MSQSTYQTVVLAQRPTANIVPGETFRLKTDPLLTEADLKDGQVLIETLYLSLDPAMRGWLKDTRSYLPPVQLGERMRGAAIGKIIASKAASFAVGDYVAGVTGWTELAIADATSITRLELPPNGKLTDALGVLGMTGLTAYFGILEVGKVKAGDFVVVSGAAGATGSVVCQIAKIKGAKVLGLAGSDEKVKWLQELGCDEALNYKAPGFAESFHEKTTDLIDVFFDNVGGEILELALAKAKPHARFVMCGAISQYNKTIPSGPRNLTQVIVNRIRMEGFIVLDFAAQYGTARKELAQWLAEGKIQRKETIVKGGLAAAEQALLGLFEGINTGKMLVEIKADEGSGSKL